jgi:hypothetical protein
VFRIKNSETFKAALPSLGVAIKPLVCAYANEKEGRGVTLFVYLNVFSFFVKKRKINLGNNFKKKKKKKI